EKKINERLKKLGGKLVVPAPTSLSKQEQLALGVNAAGDKRGLHQRENPPSSEHMKKIRAMRKFYGKQMPVPVCNSCAFSTNCPQFKPNYECAFTPFLHSHSVRSTDDLIEGMENIVT